MRILRCAGFAAVLILRCLFAVAQQPTPSPAPASSPAPAPDGESGKKRLLTPEARLAAARNVLIVRTRGADIPYDVIRTTIEGWGRYSLVATPEKADLILEVASSGGGSDIRVSGGTSTSSGRAEQSTGASKDISATDITLTVLDAQNKRVLWHARETAKYAVKEKARENNLVEAAERLASKLYDRIETPSAR